MNKLFFSAAIFFSVSFTTQASTEMQDKQQVLKMMKQYAPLVSCEGPFAVGSKQQDSELLKEIHTVEKDEDTAVYYVLWGADMGCSGGSGSMSGFVTEVSKYGDWKPLVIQDNYAFGKDVGINYVFIESIKKITPLKFEVIAWDYADEKYGGKDGGMNFPANKFRYTLEREQFEPWKITNQALLEQKR